MKNKALTFAGIIFLLVSIVHFFRYAEAYEITINHHHIPVDWSLYGGAVTTLFSVWMFIAAGKKK